MSEGKVKEYYLDRGFGSIVDSETGQELTVYANSIVLDGDKAKLLEGQAVKFDIERDRNTLTAINVAVLIEGTSKREDINTKSSGKVPKSISQQIRERLGHK